MLKYLIPFNLFICNILFGQVILTKELQNSSNQKLNAFSNSKVHSAIKGSQLNPMCNNLIAEIEFTKIEGDGILKRKGFTFTKYSEDMQFQWETTIKKSFGLQFLPYNITLANKDGIFFIELKGIQGNDFCITKFNEKGYTIKKEYQPKSKVNTINTAIFLNENGLNFVNVNETAQNDSFMYTLITFTSNYLLPSEKPILLPTDETEIKHPLKNERILKWNKLRVVDDKIILYKRFPLTTPDSSHNYVVKSIELNSKGDVLNPKSFIITNNNNKYLPTIELTQDLRSFYSFGYTYKGLFSNGIYLEKINYNDSKTEFKKEISFLDFKNEYQLFNLSKENTTQNFIEGSYELDANNGELNLLIFNPKKPLSSKTYVYSVNFDSLGAITYIYDLEYETSPFHFKRYILKNKINYYENYVSNGNFFLYPINSFKLFSNKKETVLSPIEYLYKLPNNKASTSILNCILPCKNYNSIIEINDENSAIKIVNLKK